MSEQRENRFFLSKIDLKEIQNEIVRLETLSSQRKLKTREVEKLKDLKGVSRRNFLKKAGTAAIGTAAIVGGYKTVENIREQQKKLSTLEVMKHIVGEYNTWFNDTKSIHGDDASDEFTEIYNKWLSRIEPEGASIPKLDAEYHSGKEFSAGVSQIKESVRQKGYNLLITPIRGSWRGQMTDFISVMFGKLESDEQKTVERDGKTYKYERIVMGVPEGDSLDQYVTRASGMTAQTFAEKGDVKVVQYSSLYEASSRNIFDSLQTPSLSPRDTARVAAYGDLKNLPAPQALMEIQKRMMITSLQHEEQHVADNTFQDWTEQTASGDNIQKIFVTEMRGLIAPIFGTYPKAGLYNIYNWSELSDPVKKLIGTTVTGMFQDFSGKKFDDLFDMSDNDLRKYAAESLQASNIFFDAIKNGKPVDSALQEQYNRFVDQTIKKQ